MDNERWILKHPLAVRVFHYILVFSFIPLAFTGVVLTLKPFDEAMMNMHMRVHVITGVILTIGCIAYFLMSFDRVIAFFKRCFSYGKDDIVWFSKLGGYPQKFLLKKKAELPEMGKYNSGQKLFGALLFIGGAILIGTGWCLWGIPHILPHGMGSLFGQLHFFFGWMLALFLLVHIFLGIYMFGDFKAMFIDGRIPFDEAKEMSPAWVEKELVAVQKE